MPKRDQRINYNSGYRFHTLYSDEHDNRARDRQTSTRRVSFKPSAGLQTKIKGRMAEMAIRSRLEEDEDMGSDYVGNSHFDSGRSGRRRQGSPVPKGKFGNFRKLTPSSFGWYQVTNLFAMAESFQRLQEYYQECPFPLPNKSFATDINGN